MIERRPIAPAQEKDDSRSGRLCQRTFDRRYGFALELLLGGDVVAEFTIVFVNIGIVLEVILKPATATSK